MIPLLAAAIAALGFADYAADSLRYGTLAISACLAFGLSGVALLLALRPAPALRVMAAALNVIVLVMGAALLIDHLTGSGVGSAAGRQSGLLAGLAVMLVAITQLLLLRVDRRPLLYVAAGTTALVLVIGVVALFFQMTDLHLLLAERLQPIFVTGTLTSVLMLLLSAASFTILMASPEARRYWNEREDRWIAAITMVWVTAIVLGAGMAGVGIFMQHSIDVFSHILRNSVASNATIVENFLVDGRRQALEFAGVARTMAPDDGAASAAALKRLEAVPELGIRSIRSARDAGRRRFAAPLRVELRQPEMSTLAWDGEWFLETRVPNVSPDGRLEELIVEIRADEIARLVLDPERKTGNSSVLVICAPHDADLLNCFPSALSDVPTSISAGTAGDMPPIALARSGESGVAISQDHFGSTVIAAYRPIGGTGLLISEKLSTTELLRPVREHFWWMALAIAGLLATGIVLLPRLVQPLITRLVEARAQLRAVLDNIPDAVITTDTGGRILSSNAAAEQAFGFSATELIGAPIGTLIHRPDADTVDEPKDVRTLADIEGPASELVGQRRDGHSFPVGVRVGEFTLKRQTQLVGVIRDNTEKQRAMQALATSRETLRALVENLPDLVLRFDAQLCCMYVSPSLKSLFGIEPNVVLGKTVAELCATPGFPPAIVEPLADVLARGRETSAEFSVHRDGVTRYYHTRFVPEFGLSGRCERLLCVTRDVSAVRQAELVLREVVTHNANALERERKQIAREVHDELGQVLTAIKTELALVRMRSADTGVEGSLRTMQDLADRAIHTVRDVVRALRPSTLDLGIVYALQWLSRDFQNRTHVRCSLQTPDNEDLELGDATATHLFRIVQECLTNIERHAQADAVRISLIVAGRELRLDVADNGRGFDPARLSGKSFGLLGIKERATMIGGRAVINSEPGKGTHVVIHAPLSATDEQGI